MRNITYINNSRILTLTKVLLFSFLILYTAPIFFYSNNLDSEIYYFLIIYTSIFFLFLIIRFKKRESKIHYNAISTKRFYSLILILLFSYFLIFILTKEYYIAPFNRSTRDSPFLQGNLYVIVDIIIKSIFCKLIYSCFYNKSSSKFQNGLLIILILLSILFDNLYLGARRTSVFIITSLIWAVIPFIKTRKYIILLFTFFILGVFNFLISGYRELVYAGVDDYNLNQIFTSSLLSNEYQLVSDNFLRYKDYSNMHGYGFGISIFSFPLTFIPRFIWSGKPLTIDKSTEIFPNLVGELYYNFGIFSIIFLLFYIGIILYYIKNNSIISMVLFALIPELFRTAFSTFLFTVILFYLFIKLFSINLKTTTFKNFNYV